MIEWSGTEGVVFMGEYDEISFYRIGTIVSSISASWGRSTVRNISDMSTLLRPVHTRAVDDLGRKGS